MNKKLNRFSPEMRERALRMVQEHRSVIADKVAVICLVVGAVAYVMSRLNADQI